MCIIYSFATCIITGWLRWEASVLFDNTDLVEKAGLPLTVRASSSHEHRLLYHTRYLLARFEIKRRSRARPSVRCTRDATPDWHRPDDTSTARDAHRPRESYASDRVTDRVERERFRLYPDGPGSWLTCAPRTSKRNMW